MPKGAKTDRQWTSELLAFEGSGNPKLGTEKTPKGGSKWYDEFNSIKTCPKHQKKNAASIASMLGGSDPNACVCKWHDGTHSMVQKY